MAIANHVNRNGLVKLFSGDITWDSGGSTVKLQLMEDSYVPGTATFRDVHDYLNDVSGYNPTSALAMAVTPQAPQTAAGKVYLDPSTGSVTFTSVGGSETIGGTVCYKSSSTASNSPLITLNDFSGGNVTANTSDIDYTLATNGVAQFSF